MLSVAAEGSSSGAANYFTKDNYNTVGENVEARLWAERGYEALVLKCSKFPLKAH
jgi:hypothetical protein